MHRHSLDINALIDAGMRAADPFFSSGNRRSDRENPMHNDQVSILKRTLEQLAQMSENNSMTGMLEGGAARAVARYNAILEKLEELHAIPQDIFEELPHDTSFPELGVEARMLLGALDPHGGHVEADGEPGMDFGILVRLAPFIGSDELRDLIRLARSKDKGRGRFKIDILTQLAPFLGSEDLNALIREHLDQAAEQVAPPPPVPQTPPEPPAPAPDSQPVPRATAVPTPVPDLTSLQDSLVRSDSGELAQLAEYIALPTLSNEERAAVAKRIAEIAASQASQSMA